MLLTRKIAIVTGAAATRGIGFATAKLFYQHGAQVALLDLDAPGAEAAAGFLGENAMGLGCDVSVAAQCQAAVKAVVGQWGRVDILVNNAGITQARRTIAITDEDYDRVMGVNLRGVLRMSQAAIPHMGRGAAIISIASIAAQRGGGFMGGPHYAAAKGGVQSLSKAMARDLGPNGIRSNAVNPGVIATPMTENGYDAERRQSVTQTIPLGRFGQPDDVAGACLYLASDLAAYVTGAAIDVNGGIHMH